MKNKLKYILFFGVSVFLIISIFNQNVSGIFAASGIINNQKVTTVDKPISNGRKVYLTFDDGHSY